MKKIAKIFSLTVVALFAVVILTACGGDIDENLVGTWGWEDAPIWAYTFNEDGTGFRGILGSEIDFTWNVNNGELRITCPERLFNVRNERWSYTISGNVLTLSSLQGGDQGLRYIRD